MSCPYPRLCFASDNLVAWDAIDIFSAGITRSAYGVEVVCSSETTSYRRNLRVVTSDGNSGGEVSLPELHRRYWEVGRGQVSSGRGHPTSEAEIINIKLIKTYSHSRYIAVTYV